MTPHSLAEPRTPISADGKPGEPESARTGHLSPCRPACPICTDTSDADRSDLPWPAFRWSPELEDQ